MTLYHFCAARHVKRIMREGLRNGGICLMRATGYHLYTTYIWLTDDPDARNQSWNTHVLIRFDRTAYRLTVEIPEEYEDRILDREALEKRIPGSGMLFDGWKGSENWRVFRGHIPAGWIVKAEKTTEIR